MKKCWQKLEYEKRVVVNALQFKQNSSGIGVLLRELIGAYACTTKRNCWIVLSKDSPEVSGNGRMRHIRMPWKYAESLKRIAFQSLKMGYQFCQNSLLLTTDSKISFFLPRSCILVPIVTDMALFRMPEVYRFSRVLLWKLQYAYIRRRADHYIAISEFTKKEIMDVLRVSQEKIHVVPCACSEALSPVKDEARLSLLAERFHLPKRFVLFVGNANPRKNLSRIIQAFDQLRETEEIQHHLVIAGEQGWKFDREEALRDIRHKDEIHFIGFVPDEEMAALYSAADLFVFPTLYEGFGIPVIEAQRCGTPVITSRTSSLPEIGADAAFYVDPYDVNSIARGMGSVLKNPQMAEELKQKGFENAKRFSWAASARLLDKAIEEMLS